MSQVVTLGCDLIGSEPSILEWPTALTNSIPFISDIFPSLKIHIKITNWDISTILLISCFVFSGERLHCVAVVAILFVLLTKNQF